MADEMTDDVKEVLKELNLHVRATTNNELLYNGTILSGDARIIADSVIKDINSGIIELKGEYTSTKAYEVNDAIVKELGVHYGLPGLKYEHLLPMKDLFRVFMEVNDIVSEEVIEPYLEKRLLH